MRPVVPTLGPCGLSTYPYPYPNVFTLKEEIQDGANGEIGSNCDQVIDNFGDVELKATLLRGMYTYGFERLLALQQLAIVPTVNGHNVLVEAQSGSGKIAAFSISILQQLDASVKGTQVLVLVPTRELAHQIQKLAAALWAYMNIESHACIGGTNVREEITKLKEDVHIVVGTPGRVHDMLHRRALRTDKSIIFA